MTPFIADARYERHIAAAIALAIDECARDKRYREHGGEKGLIVENHMIDQAATGTLLIMVGPTDEPGEAVREYQRAFAHTSPN